MRLERIEREEDVLLDIIECVGDPDLNDTSLACQTVDVSEEGMQIKLSMEIPKGSTIGLRLDLIKDIYRLVGEVRWTKEEGHHFVGVLLSDDSPDYKAWQEMFEIEL